MGVNDVGAAKDRPSLGPPDLALDVVAAEVGERPVRAYPALLSTEADATAWARAGGSSGSLVVADYQASPRGRSGLPWQVQPGRGLGFSLVVRPELTAEREGWSYVVASLAVAETLATDAVLEWPDTVLDTGTGARLAAVGTEAQLAPGRTRWVVVTVLVDAVLPPRAPLLGRVVSAIEDRLSMPVEDVLTAYRERCTTLGRPVTALMIPMGPGGPQVTGTAVDVAGDGALVLLTRSGRRVAVRPQNLGVLEPAGGDGGSGGNGSSAQDRPAPTG